MISSKLYEQVRKFIEGEISLRELENWYVPQIVSYRNNPDSGDYDLVISIEHALAEYSDGLIDLDDVKATLSEAIPKHRATRFWIHTPEDENAVSVTKISGSAANIDALCHPVRLQIDPLHSQEVEASFSLSL